MAEYIEREKALVVLCEYCPCDPDCNKEKCYEYMRIREMPAADVVEVRHGKWVDNGDRDSNGVPKPFAISCSVCGSSAGTSWMRYCPNCGAKMDGKGEGE